MGRRDLQQLSKEQLIELVLRLQRPDRDSRTSSKPPSTDKKEKRENSPDGAKLGHEPHNRRLADDPDEIRDHVPGGLRRVRRGLRAGRGAGVDRRIRRYRDPAGQIACDPPPGLYPPMRTLQGEGAASCRRFDDAS